MIPQQRPAFFQRNQRRENRPEACSRASRHGSGGIERAEQNDCKRFFFYRPAALFRCHDTFIAGQVSTGGAFYGIDSTIGVPFIIGNKGVEKLVELSIEDEEKALLRHCAWHVNQKLRPFGFGRPYHVTMQRSGRFLPFVL
ncbi:MAG: hypothetical protein D3906_00790 [Candidatus Electrothrix sp. AUS1_2]|nr:hypothetical protein [Candidatus Electrothrix sp. AUS1_2]